MVRFFQICVMLAMLTVTGEIKAQIIWKSNVEMNNLRGKVKEVTLYEISKQTLLHADTLAKYQQQGLKPPYYKREIRSKASYDKYGYYTEDVSFGALGRREVYTYREPGKVEEQKTYDMDGTLILVYSFTYDAEGKVKQAVRTNCMTGERVFVETFEHFPKTNTLVCTHTNTSGSTQVQQLEKHENGKLKRLAVSSDGKLIQEMICNQQGEMTEALMGSRKTFIEYAPHKRVNTTYKLDEAGRRTLMETLEATLDDYGNVLREEKRAADGTLVSLDEHSYQYDLQGNWVRCERKNSSNYLNLTYERVITYY